MPLEDHDKGDGRVVSLLQPRARVPQGLVLGLEHLVELVLGDAVAVEDDGLGLFVAVGKVKVRQQRLGGVFEADDDLGAVGLGEGARGVAAEGAVVRGDDGGDRRLAGVERGRVRDVGAEEDEGP